MKDKLKFYDKELKNLRRVPILPEKNNDGILSKN